MTTARKKERGGGGGADVILLKETSFDDVVFPLLNLYTYIFFLASPVSSSFGFTLKNR